MAEYLATFIDEYSFGYKCRTCNRTHIHGCCRDFITNRTESRSSHCENFRGNVDIKITLLTERKLNKRNMRKYIKSLK